MTQAHSTYHHHLIDRLIVLSSFVSGVSLLPEVYRVWSAHVPETMSLVTLLIIFLNSIVWFIYGMHCGLRPLLLSSALAVCTSGLLILSYVIY
jgi:uncharacterized protein with PQ loop repeat